MFPLAPPSLVSAIGVDIVSVARVARLHARFGARFLERAFHAREAARARALPAPRLGEFLASRWAAKEALHKALRTTRLLFPDVEVASGGGGAPAFVFHGAARDALRARGLDVHLSLSHEADFAVAFVLAVPLAARP
jgi:holo-[acyl-carrier protein] synthase